MSLSKRLVAGVTAVALGMGILLVGGASPAGAAVTNSDQWIWCDPTPLGVQRQFIPTQIDAPATVTAGQTFDVKVSTQLPSIVLDGFIIFNSDALWQLPDNVTLNSVTFQGGDSGKPEWNGPPNPPPYNAQNPRYPNPNNTETSQWEGNFWIDPSDEQILEINPWFRGATAIENPYPTGRPPGTPSSFGPIPAAVPEDWESNGNTVLVQSLPDPGLTSRTEGGRKGFAGRPTPQSVVFNVTVKDGVNDAWIDWQPSVASHSEAFAANFNLETNTQCIPRFCEPDVPPAACSTPPPAVSEYKMTARYIIGKTAVGNATPDFLDTPRWNRFYPDIFWMADEGISLGTPVAGGALYKPTEALARQAMSAFLYRLANPGVPAPECTTPPFIDVPVDHVFCPEIKWMADEGISTGTDTPAGKEYRPNLPLSRGAMSAFLFRLGNPGEEPPNCSTSPFTDVNSTTPFCGEIIWMADEGISEGFQPGPEYRPNATLTRQAMSAFLHRFALLEE